MQMNTLAAMNAAALKFFPHPSLLATHNFYQGWRDLNPQPSDLESAALPVRATPLLLLLFVKSVLAAVSAILLER